VSQDNLKSEPRSEERVAPSEEDRVLFAGRSQSIIALGSFSLSFLVLTALVPVLIRTLGAREYGAWVLSGGIANYVLLFDFGLSLAVTRFVARYHRSAPDQADEAITAGLAVLSVVGGLIVVVTILAAPSWESYLKVPHAAFALRAGGIATVFVLTSTIFQSALEGAGMVAISRIIQAAGSVLFVGGGISVVLLSREPLVALSLFLVVQSVLVTTALGLSLVRLWGRVPFRWPERDGWRRVLGYAITMQGSSIFVAAIDPLSRFLVVAAAGPAAVAPVDVALRARAQLFGSALAFTRPFLSELGRAGNVQTAAERADSFWQRYAPVAVATGLFIAISSYFVVPPLLGGATGSTAGDLTAAVCAMWVPALTAIVPYLLVLLYGRARDILVIQALNGFVGIGLMALFLIPAARWAPIVGLGIGSICSVLQTVRTARRRSGRADLFRAAHLLPPAEWTAISAPLAAGALLFLPGPLYLRWPLAGALFGGIVLRRVRQLIREAG
jgi:O-antigen/teichoic acid export membrane protein